MSIVFGVRGNSVDARYSSGGKNGIKVGDTANIVINTDASYLSGSNIGFSGATAKALIWQGRRNTPNGRNISCLIRMSPTYTGSPASARALFPGFYIGPDRLGRIEITHTAAGNISVSVVNEAGTVIINAVTAAAWSPTSGTIYDLVFTWDGTTTANSFKVYVDAVLQGSGITPTAAFTSSWSNEYFNAITFGQTATSVLPVCKVDEIVVWDTVITPSSVALVSGTASLNGASRTSLVDVTSFDGLSYTDPGIANVKTGTGYTQAGVSLTGTYDGSDRWTDPGIANVRSGTAYKANSTSNNRTGTAAIPTAANVRSGTSTDATTGTLVVPSAANVKTGVSFDTASTGTYEGTDRHTDPGESNVRSGTAYKSNSTSNNKTGTAVIPIAGNVRLGISTDATTGTLVVPSTSEVKTGVAFDTASTGTYDGSDRHTDPGVANVRAGTTYKDNSTTANRTGTLVANLAADVKHGVSSDGGTGTYRGADLWSALAADKIVSGNSQTQDGSTVAGTAVVNSPSDVKHGVASNSGTGTYRGADLYDVVPAGKLKTGESYTQDGSVVVGTYDGSDRHTSPTESQVQAGVTWKDNSLTDNKTGVALFNNAVDVKHGVQASDGEGVYRGEDLWTAIAAEDFRLGSTALQNGDSITGEMKGTVPPSTAREVCDVILDFIGSESLTDEEWSTIDDLTMSSTPQELYDALFSVLESRESVSTMTERLQSYFLAKGVDVTEAEETEDTESKIFLGDDLEGTLTEDTDESNVFIGGDLED
jgi:hypothetical protein